MVWIMGINMNVISIDPSKYSTGIYMTVHEVETTTIIDNPKGCSNEQAADKIYDTVYSLLDIGNGTQFDFGLIEGYSFNREKWQSIIPLAEIGGVIRLVFYKVGIPLVEIPTQSWRSISGVNKFGIDKQKEPEQYLQAIKNYFKKEFNTTDEADAYLIYMVSMDVMRSSWARDESKTFWKKLQEIQKKISERACI